MTLVHDAAKFHSPYEDADVLERWGKSLSLSVKYSGGPWKREELSSGGHGHCERDEDRESKLKITRIVMFYFSVFNTVPLHSLNHNI